jgi:RNA 2',3'-cyclic 3'-phosphodiesterase
MRLFIALPLPPEVTGWLWQFGQKLAGVVPPEAVRWVRPEGMHLTLSFLGDEVTAVQLPLIIQALDQLATVTQPFSLHLDKLGCFPKPLAPRVIWAGLAGDVVQLRQLKTGLDELLTPLGWPPERRSFSPHLTLGRVKDTAGVARASLPFGTLLQKQGFVNTAVSLYQSQLTPQGPHYTIRHTAPFQT